MELQTEINTLPEVNKQTEEAPQPEKTIYESDVDELLDSIHDEKDSFDTKIRFEDEPPEEKESEEQKEQSKKALKIIEEVNAFGAKTIVNGVDGLFAWIAGMISLDDSDKFHADAESKKDLQDILKLMMPDYKKVLPPGWQLAILAPSIYVPILKQAFDVRKTNKKLRDTQDEMQKMKADHAKELAVLKHEAELKSIKGEPIVSETDEKLFNQFTDLLSKLSPDQIAKLKLQSKEKDKKTIYKTATE